MRHHFKFLLFFLITLKANASTIEQTLNVKIGVFDAAKVNISYTLTNEQYTFSSQIQTSGMFNTFYSFKADYLTTGLIKDTSFITQTYTQKTQTSAHNRTKQLKFDKNGLLKKRISSKDGLRRTVDITSPETKIDSFDIQTVLMMLIKNFKENKSCDLNRTVFNGKKIYHINLKDNGRTLFKDKKVPLKGQAYECTAFIHQENVEQGDLLWQVSSERSIKFYLMTDKTTALPFLVKMEITSTPLGKLEAYMMDLTIKD